MDREKAKKSVTDIPFSQLIIISKDNKCYSIFNTIEIVIIMISSYYYAYLAAFETIRPGDVDFQWMLGFECFFLVSCCLKFLVTYVPDGHIAEVKELSLIVERHFKGDFLVDLIPLIPFPHFLPLGGKEKHLYFIKMMRLIKAFKLFKIQIIMNKIMKIHK
jgi:hypothetical protein